MVNLLHASESEDILQHELDILKNICFDGKYISLLDTNQSFKWNQLEQIEEQSECGSNNSIDSLIHELKLCKSVTNVKRLDGGCMNFKTKSKKSIVDEEAKIPDSNNEIDPKENSVIYDKRPSRDGQKRNHNSITTLKGSVRPATGDDRLDNDSKCDQIEGLEEQIKQMHMDLNHIRQHMVPPEDIEKFSSLSKHFNEINTLLTDLKFNCLRLQETANNNIQENKISCRPQSKMKESPITKCRYQGKSVPTIHVHSDDEIDFTNDSFAYTKPQIRNTRQRERCNPADYNNITANPCCTHRRYTEPKIREFRQREWCLPVNDVISDIELYINRKSADECLNGPSMSRKCQKSCRSQTISRKDRHDSATPSLTPSSSDTDVEQFNKIVECESQTSTTQWFYYPADSKEQYRGRGVPKLRSRRDKICETHNCTPHISRTYHNNERHGVPKQLYYRSFSTPECSRNLPRKSLKIYISNSREEQSNPRSEPFRSSTKCEPTVLPEQYDASRTSSEIYIQRYSNVSDNCKYQQFTRRKSAGSDDSQNSLNYSTANSSTKSTKTLLITQNLVETILDVIENNDPNNIALTVILKSNTLYQINISLTHTGQSLADLYTTETAIREAERQHLFERFLTFFVLNSKFTLEQKNTILGHSFQFINTDTCQTSNFKSNSNQLGNNLRLKSRFIKLQSVDNKLQQNTGINKITYESQNFSPTIHKRLKGVNSNEDLEEPNNSKNLKGPFTSSGRYIDMSNNPYKHSEEKSARIRNLELQVQALRQELSHIREELVPQEDIIKFSNLSERLRELNELLRDLRRNYQRMNDPERDNNEENSKYEKNIFEEDESRDHIDELESDNEQENTTHEIQKIEETKQFVIKTDDLKVNRSNEKYNTPVNLSHAQECDKTDNTEDNYAPPTTPECKNFFNDIKNPRNLFERHLLMMKDFRADADLRRQRLERKRREKMQQRQDKAEVVKTNQEATKETKKGRSKSNIEDEWEFTIKHIPAIRDQAHEYSKVYNTDSQPSNYMKTESNIPQTSAKTTKKIKPVTRETQTFDKYYEPNDIFDSESDTTPDPPSESIYIVSQTSHENISNSSSNVPIIQSNLRGALQDILRQYKKKPCTTVLNITLESNDIYHINIWTTTSGKSLGYLYATEWAIQEAEDQRIFTKFLTYIVVSAKNTLEQKRRLLGHSHEIIKEDK